MSLTHGLSGAVAPQLTIDGDTASSTRQIEVINPATAQVFAAVPDAGAEELDRAAAAARRAGIIWRALPLQERQGYVRKLVEVIREHIDELALLVTLEQGKPVSRARGEINSGWPTACATPPWNCRLRWSATTSTSG